MEYKCNVCGNVFDDTLGTCPACGSVVVNSAAQEQPMETQPVQEQPVQEQQPTYQYGASQDNSQAQQANYQYSNPQQPNYQQPPYQGGYQQAPYGAVDPNAKSKLAAGLLGIFLGWIGVHNFYLGNTGKAVAQLLITVLSCGTLCWVSEIWGIIEGILILTGSIKTDSTGRPLKD